LPDIIAQCEEKIASIHGRRHCILTGRGATALWIAYRLAGHKTGCEEGRVLLPALICMSPVFTVTYAGMKPLFADVRETDATFDPDAVAVALERHDDVAAVVAVHLFGQPAAMEELKNICHRKGVFLIEDAAQAQGGRDASGEMLGAHGDVAVLSFGHTKILDAGGGGALLMDRDELAEQARELVAGLNTRDPRADNLASIYSQLYYSIWKSGRSDPRFYRLFDLFPELFEPMYLYRIEPEQANRISVVLDDLDAEVDRRKRIADIYASILGDTPGVKLLQTGGYGVPWRFTFRAPVDRRNEMIRAMRGMGYDISSWYPPVPGWTPEGRRQRCGFPVAETLDGELVNLWVTPEYGHLRAGNLAQAITTYLEGS
jgi:dTDP-4-amino-4,6-dideoxygalactose transaminase